jgi:hypothetical protein
LFFVLLAVVALLTGVSYGHSDNQSKNVTSIAIEDFDQLWTWKAKPGTIDEAKAQIKIIDSGAELALLYPEEEKGKTRKSLGFKCGFLHRGYNWVEFYPPGVIELPGKSKQIQIWVCGMKYNYTLEIYVEDYRGMIHKIEMGSLYFSGWRSLTRDLPSYIPQEEENYPKDRPLRITKIVVRADPYERIDRFYVYFDQIKVITDVYSEQFDGLELIRKSDWK